MRSVTQRLFGFKVEVVAQPGRVTAYAGLPLLLETLRATVPGSVYRELRTALGYTNWKTVRRHVESLVLVLGAGGDCLDDVRVVRADVGVCVLLGGRPSSPTQLKDFLYRFHQTPAGAAWTAAEDAAYAVPGTARIRPEGPGLQVLAQITRHVVARLQQRRPHARATLDVDATILAAHKAQALRAYEGTVGYQPQMAWWAEQGVWVADEFRDGNVPAAYGVRPFLQRAFAALPAGVTEWRLRGDSALYDEAALTWADAQGIHFAVSADMSEALAAHVRALSAEAWQPYPSLVDDPAARAEEREWAEVPDFMPGWARNLQAGPTPCRYVAIRVRRRQAGLWDGDGATWRHFAVVSNMAWEGARLLRWQREKQGTVEHAHGVLKNEWGGGTLPCGRFGANAAYWRLAGLVHVLSEVLKAVALPADMSALRPKALRFQLLLLAGRVVRHAGGWVLRLAAAHPRAVCVAAARAVLAALAAEPPPLLA